VRHWKLSRKAAAGGVVLALALVAGGVAFAYVTATGSGPGSGKVGTTTNTLKGKLQVTVATCTSPLTLLPGESQTCDYTVKNTTGGQIKFGANTVTLTEKTTTVESTGAKVAGCEFSWWTVKITASATPTKLTAGSTASGGVVKLTLKAEATTTQGACLGSKPQFIVHVAA
jgi:hypothetical protein